MGYGSIYTPSIANGIVYFISDSNMYAVNEATGQKLFSYALGYSGEESSQVAISDGMLYFSGNGGTCNLLALGLDSANPVYKLQVTLQGQGDVSSTPAGIQCGADCEESYPYNTAVTLTATPAAGQQFAGWSGACSGVGSCVVNLSQARNVIANFALIPSRECSFPVLSADQNGQLALHIPVLHFSNDILWADMRFIPALMGFEVTQYDIANAPVTCESDPQLTPGSPYQLTLPTVLFGEQKLRVNLNLVPTPEYPLFFSIINYEVVQ